MALFSRDKNDNRSAGEIAEDITHDLYHRVAKWDRDHPDGQKDWRHVDDDCEFTRSNPRGDR